MRHRSSVTADIRAKLKDYALKVHHSDGLYRHLYAANLNQHWPGNCSFHVLTAPYTVTIYGDWMNAYTLQRNEDMLHFCHVSSVDYSYWAEKLQLTNKHRVIEQVTEESFYKDLHEYLTEYDEYTDNQASEITAVLEDYLDFDNGAHPWVNIDRLFQPVVIDVGEDMTFSTDAIDAEIGFGLGVTYTHEWFRVCEALRWTAEQWHHLNTKGE